MTDAGALVCSDQFLEAETIFLCALINNVVADIVYIKSIGNLC